MCVRGCVCNMGHVSIIYVYMILYQCVYIYGGGDFVPSHELIKAGPRVRKVADPRPGGSTTRSGSTTRGGSATGGKIHDPADPRPGRPGRIHDRGRSTTGDGSTTSGSTTGSRSKTQRIHDRKQILDWELFRTAGELLRS